MSLKLEDGGSEALAPNESNCHFPRIKLCSFCFLVLYIGYHLLAFHNNIDGNLLCLMSFLLVLLLSYIVASLILFRVYYTKHLISISSLI